ncbi:hypothetical protein K435DRAFT_862258 [Dendrothele bispora CBS 962.96]|uniref:Uncharacterized protein n=1 Tax=Dendrothele bispora (strain CBS 962.96) TaxID=1314807 RepID=A0A4S8LT29_DENBC|nr:hypothetical protein K435DRAFT_862258 [Dendrothele bispora CBS 962.96]
MDISSVTSDEQDAEGGVCRSPRKRTRNSRYPPDADECDQPDAPSTPKKRQKQLKTPNAPVKPKRSPTDAAGEVQPLINRPFDFSFGDELLYPSSPYPDTISDTAKSPVQAQYIYDEKTLLLKSILTRLQQQDLIFEALSDLSKLAEERMFLILQDFRDEDRTLENIKMTFIRELLCTEQDPGKIWDAGANLFYMCDEWMDLVQNRVPELKAGPDRDDPQLVEYKQETVTPLTPITPRTAKKLKVWLEESPSPTMTIYGHINRSKGKNKDQLNVSPITVKKPQKWFDEPLNPSPSPSPEGKNKAKKNQSTNAAVNDTPGSSGTPTAQKATIASKLAAYNIAPPATRPPSTAAFTDAVTLPLRCEVTNAELQDKLLQMEGVYDMSLPALKAGSLVSWSSTAPRKGTVKYTEWVSLGEDVDPMFLMNLFKFTRHGQFLNPARFDPRDLTAYHPPSNAVRRVIYTLDSHEPAIFMFPNYVENSKIKSFAMMNTPTPKRFHKIEGLLHSHDADRAIAVITMLVGEGSMQVGADIYGDVVTWSTRFEQDTENRSHRVYSSSASGSSVSSSTGAYSLPFDAEVPIYDARWVNGKAPEFDISQDLPQIDVILPRYNNEIPAGSLMVVASTISSTTNAKIAGVSVKVNFDLRFVIVLGIPSGA